MSAPEGRIVLIAGEGALPVEIARRLHERGNIKLSEKDLLIGKQILKEIRETQ